MKELVSLERLWRAVDCVAVEYGVLGLYLLVECPRENLMSDMGNRSVSPSRSNSLMFLYTRQAMDADRETEGKANMFW